MRKCWEVLRTAGVPDGAARPVCEGSLEPASVATAFREAVADLESLGTSERECLAAWLAAFRHHWPERFATVLGAEGDLALRRLDPYVQEPNRYLKLRRIAIENLAVLV